MKFHKQSVIKLVKELLPFVLVACLLVTLINAGNAKWSNVEKYTAYRPYWSVEEHNGSIPLNTIAPLKVVKKEAETKEKQTPLILIHGTMSDLKPYTNWGFLVDELKKPEYKSFVEKHPVYLFRYSSSSDESAIAEKALKESLEQLLQDYPKGTKIKLVVSSLGGNIFCNSLNNETEIVKTIDSVISVGTPFWGTPLLNEDLSVMGDSRLGFVNKAIYKGTKVTFPSLNSLLRWKLPIDQDESKMKPSESNLEYCSNLKSKFVNYAAIMDSPGQNELNQDLSKDNDVSADLWLQWLSSQVTNTNYKNAWNSVMHYKFWEISSSLKNHKYFFYLNDGLVPVYSSLWLNPTVDYLSNSQVLLQKIQKDKPKARIFGGMNHSNFTDNTIDSEGSQSANKVKDLFSGEKGTIAQFIIKDLNNS